MRKSVLARVTGKVRKTLNQIHAYDYPETAETWEKDIRNPILCDPEGGSLFDPFVRQVNGRFLMCVSRRKDHSIMFYDSEDGIRWENGRKVLCGKNTDNWERCVNRACFLKHEDKWYLWYTGQNDGKSCIGLAISTDGQTFERYSEAPVLIPEYSYEGTAVMNPCVIWDEEQKHFCMWYAAGENYEPDVIAYAQSIDGIQWEKHTTPVMTAKHNVRYQRDKVGACDVIRLPNGYYGMAYIAYQNINVARICLAVSQNGITDWEICGQTPVLSPGKHKWDSHAVYKPTIQLNQDGIGVRIWYNGRRNHTECIGTAMTENDPFAIV